MQLPCGAETDPSMDAIVVSDETLPGALSINTGRIKRGFTPLFIVVVPAIGHRADGSKLSSTDLRSLDSGETSQ